MKDKKTFISLIGLSITVLVLLGNLIWGAARQYTETVYVKESLRRIEAEIDAIGTLQMDYKQHCAIAEERFKALDAARENAKEEIERLKDRVR